MDKLPQISEAEFEIMKIIWEDSPISAKEICERAGKVRDWNEKTVHTLVRRLYEKQAIDYQKQGRKYYYYPIVSRKKYLKQENQHFLNHFYNGKAVSMFVSLLASTELSVKELDEISAAVKEKRKLKKGKSRTVKK